MMKARKKTVKTDRPTRAARSKKGAIADHFPEFSNASEFEALSDADKEKVTLYYEQGRHRGETRPLNAKERAEARREKKQMGRPRIGKGAKVISLSVERGLLARADAFAREHGIKRAELVAQGLLAVMDGN